MKFRCQGPIGAPFGVVKVRPQLADDADRAALRRFLLRICTMKKTILLVEDSKVQKLAGERILFKAGYLVLLAGDGEEALHLAHESVPDLVLLDLLLPGIGGEEVLYALKRDSRTEQIPVIVVSHLPPTNFAQLKAAGAAEYFHKSRFLEDNEGQIAFLVLIDRVLSESEARNATGKPMALATRRP
jgi:CheY-like chemotaxis protein